MIKLVKGDQIKFKNNPDVIARLKDLGWKEEGAMPSPEQRKSFFQRLFK